MDNSNAVDSYVRTTALADLINREPRPKFPLTVTACKMEPPAVFAGVLSGLRDSRALALAPVTVRDISLESGRKIAVDDKAIEIPNGVKKRITIRALKRLSKAYPGSIVLVKKGNSWKRLRNSDVVELPGPGENVEFKNVPSFQLE